MYWYNYMAMACLLIALIGVVVLTLTNKQYKRGKSGEIVSFMMLASVSTFVGVGIRSELSLLFYLLSFVLACAALALALKANQVRNQ